MQWGRKVLLRIGEGKGVCAGFGWVSAWKVWFVRCISNAESLQCCPVGVTDVAPDFVL